MIKIGITGIIGSGKTTVARIFEILGGRIYYADQEAKKLYSNQEVIQEVIKAFGTGILGDDDRIDLKKLSTKVFSDKDSIEKINNIIHPRVKKNLENWILKQDNAPLLVYESALLFESGFYKTFDKTIAVAAPENLCIDRVIKRSGLTGAEIKNRMVLQYSNEEKSSRADIVIVNDGKQMLIPQVQEIFRKFIQQSE